MPDGRLLVGDADLLIELYDGWVVVEAPGPFGHAERAGRKTDGHSEADAEPGSEGDGPHGGPAGASTLAQEVAPGGRGAEIRGQEEMEGGGHGEAGDRPSYI
jgi:hypothetical protein